ncbi:histidine kinase-like ATPase [Peziza echinospora]|nr:histidine kinase-like ATPase [Peziza echinospora]
MTVETTLFSIRDLIYELEQLTQYSFTKEGIDFSIELELGPPPPKTQTASISSKGSEQFDIEEMSADESDTESAKPSASFVSRSTVRENYSRRSSQSTARSGITNATAQAVENSTARSDSKHSSISDPDPDLIVFGDEKKIKRILISFLSNAFKFTHHGKVILRVKPDDNIEAGNLHVRFEVEDTGIGISPKVQSKILWPFEDVITSVETVAGGTGLGLTLSRSHADLINAEIECTSKIDVGSTFALIVPLKKAPENAKYALMENRQKHRSARLSQDAVMFGMDQGLDAFDTVPEEEESKRQLNIEGKQILIVEDNWAHQVVTQKRLKNMGCISKVAMHGQNALDLLTSGAFVPDLIMMDLQMPMMVSI